MNSLLRESFGIVQLLAIRGSGLLALFLVNVLIARNYGAATLGLFQLAMATVLIAATAGRCGQDQLMLRVVAEAKATNTPQRAQENLMAGLALATIVLLLSTALVIFFLKIFGSQFNESTSQTFLMVMALGIAPTGLLFISTEALRGWQHVNLAVIWQSSIPQALTFALLLIFGYAQSTSDFWIPAAYVISVVIACVCAFFTWQHIIKLPLIRPNFSMIQNAVFGAANFWLYAILTVIIAWIDVLLLQSISNVTVVGTYSAIVRTGAVLGTVVQIVSAGAVAKLALYYAQKDFVSFANCFRRYFQLFAMAAIPIAIMIFMFPETIMSIWGQSYADSRHAFEIYASFQILNFVLCLTGFSVAVMGLEKQLVAIQTIAIICKIVFIFVGYSCYKIEGALWGSGASLLLFNVLSSVIFIKRMQSQGISFFKLIF